MFVIVSEHAMELGMPPLLMGKASRDLKVLIDKSPSLARSRTLIWFSKFFSVSTTVYALYNPVMVEVS